MIRSENHSSYPRVGDSPLDQQLRTARRRFDAGKIDRDAWLEAVDEATTIVVAEQSRAFIDIVTDGGVGHDGPWSASVSAVDGLESGEWVRWFETNFYDRRPVVVGDLRRRHSWLGHGAEVAATVSLRKPVKAVMTGPATFVRLARDEHYMDADKLADDYAAVLADEVTELRGAGTSHFQFDEPLLCRHPEDLDRIVRTLTPVVAAAGEGAVTTLSTYFGNLNASADRLGELPCSHLGLDMTAGSGNDHVLKRVPDGMGVNLGLFDATRSAQEDANDVAIRLETHRGTLESRDVIVGPNTGLELLSRDQAFDKLLHARYLVEKLQKEWSWQ
ncbi:MAG: hypothetical protein OEV00_11715 [Acidobacteriota bacterium]|nr:hypothetical protein [Acidobacteriota bacterium]MDH3785978.1 hypothetical protein [Acidobacteriota bacterium]